MWSSNAAFEGSGPWIETQLLSWLVSLSLRSKIKQFHIELTLGAWKTSSVLTGYAAFAFVFGLFVFLALLFFFFFKENKPYWNICVVTNTDRRFNLTCFAPRVNQSKRRWTCTQPFCRTYHWATVLLHCAWMHLFWLSAALFLFICSIFPWLHFFFTFICVFELTLFLKLQHISPYGDGLGRCRGFALVRHRKGPYEGLNGRQSGITFNQRASFFNHSEFTLWHVHTTSALL